MATGPHDSRSRSVFSLLRDRNFAPFFFGNFASNTGTWFWQIPAAVVVFDVTGSTLMVGLVAAFQYLPFLLLAPWTGAAADRFDRKGLLMVCQAVAALAAAALAAVTLSVGLERFPGAWPVLATALVIGVASATSTPAMQALVPALVPKADLDPAIALNSVTFNLARAFGPALGAAALVSWGAGVAFGINALSYMALIGGLLLVIPRPVSQPRRASVWVGFRYLRTDPRVAVLLIGVAALGFGFDPVITLTPALANQLVDSTFTRAEDLVGWMVSLFGTGAMLAALLVPRVRARWGHRSVAVTGLLLLATGITALSLAPGAPWALAAMALAGAGYLLGVTCLTSLLYLRIPGELLGRVMALWGVAFLGSRPLAALLDGAIADLTSPAVAARTAAAIVVVGALVVRRLVPPGRAPVPAAPEVEAA